MNIKYFFIFLFSVLLCSGIASAMEEHIKAHIDARKNQPGNRLYWAVHTNQIKDVQKLLSKDLDINASYVRREFNPLQHAVEKGHNQMVQFLIEHGADVDHQDANGCTLVHYKSMKNADKVMKLLIDAGVRVDIKNHKGKTPYQCNMFLIEQYFYTPFLEALQAGDEQKVMRYIQQGGITNFPYLHNNPLDRAVQSDNPIVARLLLLQGVALGDRVGVESPFVRCNGNVEMIRTLIVTPQGLLEPGNDWADLHDRLFALMCCIKRRCGKKICLDMRKMLCQYVINDGIVRDPTKDRKVIRQEQSAFLYSTWERKNCIHINSYISELLCSYIAHRVVPYSMATLCHAAIFGLLDKQNNGRILDQFTDKHIIMVSSVLGDLQYRRATRPESLRKKGWSEAAITLLDSDKQVLNSNFGKKIKNEYKQLIFGKGNGRKRK